ncbi:fungal-specific transcription factor domain-containing protein [Flammula alnicola]|nr:fungal-specific transcription factor domain-containing protein [Flammula alnicola]
MAMHVEYRPVKTEGSSSPDLSPSLPSAFQFKFHASHGPLSHSPLYRFGSDFDSPHWPPHSTAAVVSHLPPRVNSAIINENGRGATHFYLDDPQRAMSYSDEYDDLAEIPSDQALASYPGSTANAANDRTVRRRSSKACDQCRKSKCKCERTGPNEPCKNCIMLGTPCTFLGPSRKRGPPKGYIDAIEARLHQTEALLGIMLATSDARAQSLLRDIGKDPLAKEIITRVDNSPYGVKGRKREDIALSVGGKLRSAQSSETSLPGGQKEKTEADKVDLTIPRTNGKTGSLRCSTPPPPPPLRLLLAPSKLPPPPRLHQQQRHLHPPRTAGPITATVIQIMQPTATSATPTAPHRSPRATAAAIRPRRPTPAPKVITSSVDGDSMSSESEEEFTGAMGQLSLNEDEQVRYHGRRERVDRRNEGGICARLAAPALRLALRQQDGRGRDLAGDGVRVAAAAPQVQEHLLDLYFTYVQPLFPIVHKQSFWESYKAGCPRRRRVPPLLLLSMYALRRATTPSPPRPLDPAMMWSAGDEYLDSAKILLDTSYSSSRPRPSRRCCCWVREIGIGAMAQAWTYIGMGIRMAQDLGMHRSAEGIFGERELGERRRVWFGCVIMDKYVSTYIGRPLMIFEWDFDTPLPKEDDPEEFEEWSLETPPHGDRSPGVPGRSISSGILSTIVQTIYAVRPVSSRHAESAVLEGLLDKWYLDLPDHLRYEPAGSAKQPTPLPNVLTLHMQYWCAVLLLHRPFIRHIVHAKQRQSEVVEDPETRAIAAKSYELCNAAANHITSIVSLYQEKYLISRCSVFLCYYVFTASIMHDTNLTVHPNDPQARIGLMKCMSTLRAMATVWPSAARALDLFGGAKGELSDDANANPPLPLTSLTTTVDRHKRAAESALDDSSFAAHASSAASINSPFDYMPSLRNQNHNPTPRQQQQQHRSSSGMASSTTMGGGYSWQAGDMNPHNFNTPLSTAVLPQLYSTGLVDDGVHHHHHHHASHASASANANRVGSSSHADPHSRSRYPPPQYFDYSSYPQLAASAYDIQPESVQVPHHPQQQHPQQQQQQQQSQQPSQMYLPEQYSIYNNQPYNNR